MIAVLLLARKRRGTGGALVYISPAHSTRPLPSELCKALQNDVTQATLTTTACYGLVPAANDIACTWHDPLVGWAGLRFLHPRSRVNGGRSARAEARAQAMVIPRRKRASSALLHSYSVQHTDSTADCIYACEVYIDRRSERTAR